MRDHPLVSVVIAVYRPHREYFREAVRSVLEQTYDDLELVIVEDPSDEPGREVLAAFTDSRIRHVVNPVRRSLVRSRNQTLELARGEFVAVLDADDACLPDRIRAQVAFLEQHPDVCVVGTQLEIIGPSGALSGRRHYPQDHESIVRAMARFNPVAHPTAMLRRRVAVDLDEYFYDDCSAEDYDLWCRLARKGARFANMPDALVRYRLHPGARKARVLRDTIRATLDIKEKYWRGCMSPADRLRMYGERLMLVLPPSLVYRLFLLTQNRTAPRRDG